MNPTERQNKYRTETFYSSTVAEVVEAANTLIAQHPHLTLESIEVGTTTEYGDTYTCFEYWSPETDSEMNRRITDEKRTAEYRRRQYETLKKEFEGGSKA